MATIASLKVDLLVDSTRLNKSLADATAKMHAFGNKMTDIGATMSTRLTLPIMAMGGAMVKAFTEEEDAIARMTAALRANGGQAGITAGEIQNLASSLQKVTTFGDEATISASALLLTFHKVRNEMGKGNDIFNRTIKASQDLASALGKDLQSATMQLARALENPTTGLMALTRSGIIFSEQQKEMIKTLVESGRQLEAQAMILDVVESKYKGTAETMAKTVSGQIKQAFNAFGDEMERFGKIISQDFVIPVLKAVGKVTEFLGRLEEGTRKTVVAFAGLTALVGPLLVGLGLMTSSVANLTRVMMANPYIALGAAILAIGTYAVFSSGALDSMNSKILRALEISAETLGTEEARNKLLKDRERLTSEISKKEAEIQALREKFGGTIQGAQYISAQSIQLNNIKAQLKETESLIKESEKLIKIQSSPAQKFDAPSLATTITTAQSAIGSIAKLNEELKALTEQFEATASGSERADLAKKIGDVEYRIEQLRSVLTPATAELKLLKEEIAGDDGFSGADWNSQYEGVKIVTAQMKLMESATVMAQQTAISFTDSFGAGMANLIVQGGKLTEVLSNIGKLLLSSAIQTGIKLLLMGTSGFGVTGGSTGLLGGLFSPSVSAVPTGVMGAGTMSVSGSFKVQGTDLIAVINRSERQLR
jgi:hypothetical protein